ncbi:cytochrome P450 [Diplogelasinospora grovesii]|uniref:Cytochrome P450 n=1 Tax=Diplogelasinospora grovesii TaxID=303347 RepID=A0AAN6NB79_9PEZI|nr:cytochrome P450 [Diplogelasinospora grovesii]
MTLLDSLAQFTISFLDLPLSVWLAWAVGSFVLWRIAIWYRLRHVPGPTFNGLSSLWLVNSNRKGAFYTDLQALADKFWDLVRVGPHELFSSDLDVLRRMSSPKSAYTRGEWYRTFRFIPTEDHSFSLLDEAKHSALRTRLGPGYSNTNAIEKNIDAQVARFVSLIDRKFLSAEEEFRPVDFSKISLHSALDVLGDINFGKAFGFLDEGTDMFGYIEWFEGFFRFAMMASIFPRILRIIQTPLCPFLSPADADRVGMGRVTRKGEETAPRDMISLFKAQGIAQQEAVNEVLLQIVAGSDSVATVLRTTLLHLINTPTALTKVRAELDEARLSGRTSSPFKDVETRSLPYFQAVMREGWRIFPAVTPLSFKKVPKIGHNVFGVSRSEKYWGEDADLSRSERWLEADPGRIELMNTAVDVVFGFGKYKLCLLLRYDFSVVNATKPLSIIKSGFFMMSDFWLRITKREDA